jgi:alanyl-tRNA synthetase
LTENYSEVLKKNEALLNEKASNIARQLLSKSISLNDFQLIVAEIDESIEMAKSIALQIKSFSNNTTVLLHGKTEGKAMICLMFTDDLVQSKNLDASAYIKSISKEIQGGGGGQKHLATAGGKNTEGILSAVNHILNELNKL